MDDITVIKLTRGSEIVGRHVPNPLNSNVILDDALNIIMQPTQDGRVQIGLAPITLAIEPETGKTGHRVEFPPADIMIDGPAAPLVAEVYHKATSRIEIASVVPSNVRSINKHP